MYSIYEKKLNKNENFKNVLLYYMKESNLICLKLIIELNKK